MALRHGLSHEAGARSRATALLLGALAIGVVAYACWRGYQNPDFLLRVGAAFGLC